MFVSGKVNNNNNINVNNNNNAAAAPAASALSLKPPPPSTGLITTASPKEGYKRLAKPTTRYDATQLPPHDLVKWTVEVSTEIRELCKPTFKQIIDVLEENYCCNQPNSIFKRELFERQGSFPKHDTTRLIYELLNKKKIGSTSNINKREDKYQQKMKDPELFIVMNVDSSMNEKVDKTIKASSVQLLTDIINNKNTPPAQKSFFEAIRDRSAGGLGLITNFANMMIEGAIQCEYKYPSPLECFSFPYREYEG